MRYRIDPRFWDRCLDMSMQMKDLAARTPHGVQFLYRLHRDPNRTVSAAWVDAAVAAFPMSQRAEVRSLFTLVSERYWIRPEFWGLLASRRIKLAPLAPQVGMSAQQLHRYPAHPTYTIDVAVMERMCEVLSITDRSVYFTPAIKRIYKRRPPAYPLAS